MQKDSPNLAINETYSREEVHDIFSPDTVFTPKTGSWGISGIVPVPESQDYVFLVTIGRQISHHTFDEGITTDGVFSWQSQSQQRLSEPQIKRFINHNELESTIHLFLRINKKSKYTYGQLN